MIAALSVRVPMPAIRALSHDGRVYRAYDHLIAAQHGRLLLVPVTLVDGRLDVVDLCPVPFIDVLDLLDDEAVLVTDQRLAEAPAGAPGRALAPGEWRADLIALDRLALGPQGLGRPHVVRWSHDVGIRYAVTLDLLMEGV